MLTWLMMFYLTFELFPSCKHFCNLTERIKRAESLNIIRIINKKKLEGLMAKTGIFEETKKIFKLVMM